MKCTIPFEMSQLDLLVRPNEFTDLHLIRFLYSIFCLGLRCGLLIGSQTIFHQLVYRLLMERFVSRRVKAAIVWSFPFKFIKAPLKMIDHNEARYWSRNSINFGIAETITKLINIVVCFIHMDIVLPLANPKKKPIISCFKQP